MKYNKLKISLIAITCLVFLIVASQVKDVHIIQANGTDLPFIQIPSATLAPTLKPATATALPTFTSFPTFTPSPTSTFVIPTPLDAEELLTAWQTQVALATPARTPVAPQQLEKFPKVYIQEGNLYFQNSENQSKQLTYSGKDRDPIVSDDGQKIVFFRAEAMDKMYSINSDGSKEKALVTGKTSLVSEKGEIKSPVFVPGKHLVLFNTYLCSPSKGIYVYPECVIGLYALDTETREINKIVEDIKGNSQRDKNFEISPDGNYVSVAGAGNISLYSLASGRFQIAYPKITFYYITSNSEYLPKQYWLPDSSGLIILRAADGEGNDPTAPPFFYDVFHYSLGAEQASQLQLGKFLTYGDPPDTWCISPDRSWIFFAGNETGEMRDNLSFYYLGNLANGQTTRVTPFQWSLDCKWSPDSRHFSFTFEYSPGLIGAIDGPPTPAGGLFTEWIDSTHYYYTADEKTYIGEVKTDHLAIVATQTTSANSAQTPVETSPKELAHWPSNPAVSISDIVWSQDGTQFAAGTITTGIGLYDPQTLQQIQTIKTNGPIDEVVFSPNNRVLAYSFRDSPKLVWDVMSGNELKPANADLDSLWAGAFSPDGKLLASQSLDGHIQIWDLADGHELNTLSGDTNGINLIVFSSDDTLLAAVWTDGSMGIWNVTSGKLLRSWKGKPHLVWNLAFSPNGKLLASGLMGGSILLWDSESGKELKPLMGHTAVVPCVAFSPDGRTLASGSADKTIKLWDLASGNELQTLKSPYEVHRVAFSPDGRLLAVSSFEFPEGMVQLWRLQP